MLTFLRVNSFFQIITLFVILLLLKLPFSGGNLPLLLTDLEWILVGEKINNGHLLYGDINTTLGPLSALVFQILNYWSERNQLPFELTAYLLIFIQALYFNHLCNARNALLEKNYFPAFVYILLMNVSFDVGKLSPILMGITFVLIAFNVLLRQIENRMGVSDDVFEVGLFIGIASLFHFPLFVFLVWGIISLIFYTGVNIRQLFLVVLGYILPWFFAILYFYYTDSFTQFYDQFVLSTFSFKLFNLKDIGGILISYILAFIVSLIGIFKILRINRYNSFQNRTHQIIIFYGFFGIGSFLITKNPAPFQLMAVIPFLAFFIAGYFQHLKGTFIPELLFTLFVLSIILIEFQGVKPIIGSGYEHLTNLQVKKSDLKEEFKGKKILITGNRIDNYVEAKPATGYINWDLAKIDLENPNNYESAVNIYKNFKKDPPEVILDNQKVFKPIFERLPSLKEAYILKEENVYIKK